MLSEFTNCPSLANAFVRHERSQWLVLSLWLFPSSEQRSALFPFLRAEGPQKLSSDQPVLQSRHETLRQWHCLFGGIGSPYTGTGIAWKTWRVLTSIHSPVRQVCALLSTAPERCPRSLQRLRSLILKNVLICTH